MRNNSCQGCPASTFHFLKRKSGVKEIPNKISIFVVAGMDQGSSFAFPRSVARDVTHCDQAGQHNNDARTITLPWRIA
jgi:hypothetical protein